MKQLSLASIILSVILFANGSGQAQTWTALTNPNPSGGTGTMLLLTDGTVIAQGPGTTNAWTKLTPDSSGNYIAGTWSSIASMGTKRLYFGSVVLPSGKVFVLGGEYSGASGAQNLTNTGEIYDPVANTWTPTPNFPQGNFGDDPLVLLNTGKVLGGYFNGPQTYLFDPTSLTWTQSGTKLLSDASDEETWLQLPNGNILTYNIFASPASGPGTAQQYNPTTGQWSSAGTVPVPLTGSAFGYELGPGARLPDGRYFLVGANNNTVLYTPSTNTWAAGPQLPANMGADDAPGAMLPNGHFIFAADTSAPNIFTAPTHLFDFNYTNNTLTDVTPTGGLNGLLSSAAYVQRMLVLPNGHMLFGSAYSSTVWDYAPSGSPQSSWQPVITNIASAGTNTYILTGTQLTGISEGASYGDDALMSTNYPIVKLTSTSGKVYYAKTTNWTPGVATGALSTSVQFVVPTGLANGNYQVQVVASGIASAARTLTIGPQSNPATVTATFTAASNTLVLKGDTNPNSLTVTFTPTTNSGTTGILKVQGANGTSIALQPVVPGPITSTAAYQSFNVTGPVTLTATFQNGNCSFAAVDVTAAAMSVTMGTGTDNVSLSLCKINGNLNVTANPGSAAKAASNNILFTSSTVSGTKSIHGFNGYYP